MGKTHAIAITEIPDIQAFYIVYKISRLKEEFFGSLKLSDKLNSRLAARTAFD
jgi:hypothetical protein